MTKGGDPVGRAALVLSLRSLGITDHRVLNAFEQTPRSIFAPTSYAADAEADRLIPIACGQTMEAPSVLARLLKAVPVNEGMSVLEIGTGSGYFTALLSQLAKRVISLERFRTLSHSATQTLDAMGARDVECVFGDGLAGWPSSTPYDAIFVTGSVGTVSQVWLDQLTDQGRLVAPIGPPDTQQQWTVASRSGVDEIASRALGTTFSAQLVAGVARAL
ncbi:MAG: protein-L-isoaspartate(D-aspartate) O-methyltransferase [Pseudomonadota bacterium]